MNIFITTCSMNKAGGGKAYGFYDWKNQGRGELLAVRRRVLNLMESHIVKSSLKLPYAGPDFGTSYEAGDYLPALKRYSQGAFVEGLKASKTRLSVWGEKNRLYFISGLYGLVHYKEPIQNYDLDMYQIEVQEAWKKSHILTKMPLSDLMWKREEQAVVFDCCANETYRELLDWKQLQNEGFVVRHAVSSGDFTGRQVRWACGYLTGAVPERLADMIAHEGSQYTSDNGSIRFVKDIQIPIIDSKNKKMKSDQPSIEPLYASVAVACLRPTQYISFMNYARKHGWDKFARFEPIPDLSRSTVKRFDEHGFKMLIAHVDETHVEVRKGYKVKSRDFTENLPSDWQYRTVTNESYADIQFGSRLLFKTK